MHILVAGGSGYVGGRLVPRLLARNHQLTLLSRDPELLHQRFPEARAVYGDLLDPPSLQQALREVDIVYHLAHSLRAGSAKAARRNLRAAANLACAAAGAGVGRIIYLGSLGRAEPLRRPHQASRHAVGAELARYGTAVTEFRAGVIIGSGSASFEILRSLVERLPVMILPRWVAAPCQPIAIRDVLSYLVEAADRPELTGVVEIGGPQVLTYRQLLEGYARIRRLNRLLIPAPMLTPRLSSYWVSLISPVPVSIARTLIEGLRSGAVVRDPSPAKAFGIQPLTYEKAVELAMDRLHRSDVESTWFDAYASRRRRAQRLTSLESLEGMIVERRVGRAEATADAVFERIERIGGRTGWLYADLLWQVRGAVDRLLGGVGMRLGRRDASRVRPGDAVDFWRVEEIHRPRLLRLRAEMRMPGRAWLQFEVEPGADRCRLVQTAFFEPRGLLGLVYWYGLYPVHRLIFAGLLRRLTEPTLRSSPRADPSEGAG